MKSMDTHLLSKILSNFNINEDATHLEKISTGYINDTYKLYISEKPKYILQKINTVVFKNVENIFHNIDLIQNNKVDIGVKLITSKSKKLYTIINNKDYWRLMSYEPGSYTFNNSNKPTIAFECGKVLSEFHKNLNTLNINNFKDIIPNFHNLPYRLKEFKSILKFANKEEIINCTNQINFVKKISSRFDSIYNNKLDLRLCHNDSKLNNILFNKKNKAIYLIDLDTIMPGLILYDFGDTVRTIVNPVSEEETDLNKIKFNKKMFVSFIDGFQKLFTNIDLNEKKLLPLSVALMPFMHGLRALSDHLNGNKYFKVTYVNQNLIRAKNLFKFSEIALENEIYMKKIIDKY